MKEFKFAAVGLMVVLCLSASQATIRYVSQTGASTYSSVNAGYNASVAGDTILIGPGTYTESGVSSLRRLTWIGAGWDQTVLNITSGIFYFNTAGASGSSLEGVHIINQNAPAIYAVNNADSITIRRCLLEHGSTVQAVVEASSSNSRLYFEDCIFNQTAGYYTVGMPNASTLFRGCIFAQTVATTWACLYSSFGTPGTTELYNNDFVGYSVIFNLPAGSLPVVAINNVFYDWGASPTYGTYSNASTFDYNASQTVPAPGTNTVNITANPFVNYDSNNNYVYGTSNLHLVGGSPLINTGHPNLLDPDGSRSDFGAYGGPKPLVDLGVPNYPWAINVVATPDVVGPGSPVTGTGVGRVGPQY